MNPAAAAPAGGRGWRLAYGVAWTVAAGGGGALAAAVGWVACGPPGLDDDIAPLVGGGLGCALGALAARATVHSRRTHNRLVAAGALVAIAAGLATAALLAAAGRQRGQGPFAGLGEAILGIGAAAVALVGVLLVAAGVCGRLADRTASPTATARPGSGPGRSTK